MPPIPETISGVPARRASWITTGEFSHQMDGITTQPTEDIRPSTSAAS